MKRCRPSDKKSSLLFLSLCFIISSPTEYRNNAQDYYHFTDEFKFSSVLIWICPSARRCKWTQLPAAFSMPRLQQQVPPTPPNNSTWQFWGPRIFFFPPRNQIPLYPSTYAPKNSARSSRSRIEVSEVPGTQTLNNWPPGLGPLPALSSIPLPTLRSFQTRVLVLQVLKSAQQAKSASLWHQPLPCWGPKNHLLRSGLWSSPAQLPGPACTVPKEPCKPD